MRSKTGKTALVLAGGGLTGAVYEMGALRAMDDLLVDRTVNDFDIYVGTSAGALIASLLANGVTPDTMFEVINGSHPIARSFQRHDLFNFNRSDIIRTSVKLPNKLLHGWSNYLHNRSDMTFFDFLWSLAEAMPSGLYDSLALERYIRESLPLLGASNRFSDLERALYIIATNLDNGERAVFGGPEQQDVPISLAVAASSAMPLFYKPVLINEHEYVDGGLRGNASLDLAIEQGATLVVCINPIVPYDNTLHDSIPFLDMEGGFLSERGVQAVTSQTLAILLHSGLHYHVKQLRRRHREVDIILIEPQADDKEMHFRNIMHYSERLTIARHGFEAVTLDLAEDYDYYQQILSRHGIPVTRGLLIEETQRIVRSNYDPRVIQEILYSNPKNQARHEEPVARLSQALQRLEVILEGMGEATGETDS